MRNCLPWMVMALVALGAAPVLAQTEVGVRAGLSADPDQFVFGAHYETGPLADDITFRPNLEIGVGDDVTAVTGNLEFVYSFDLDQRPWRVYLGGGPAIVVYSFDRGPGPGGDSDVGGGFNVVVGAQHDQGLFGELKVGGGDSPDLKVTLGFVFD